MAREAEVRRPEADLPAARQMPFVVSNPLKASRPAMPASSAALDPGPLPTQTIPARTVFHEANAALAPLINRIQTQEQLIELLDDLQGLREVYEQAQFNDEGTKMPLANTDFREPRAHDPKGRPRVQGITNAMEGRPRGGGAPRGNAQAVGG